MNESVQNLFEKVKTTAQSAGRATGQVLDQAGKKAGEQWEIIKLQVQAADREKEAEVLLGSIGRLVYAAHLDPNSDTERVDALLAEIDGHQAEIRDIKSRIAELKQLKICPDCGKKLSKDDSFCRFCGKSL